MIDARLPPAATAGLLAVATLLVSLLLLPERFRIAPREAMFDLTLALRREPLLL